jgi:hypothetical protein
VTSATVGVVVPLYLKDECQREGGAAAESARAENAVLERKCTGISPSLFPVLWSYTCLRLAVLTT